MNELDACTARVHSSATLAELLEAGFDAFEVIRLVARACEDWAPDLFAAFMTAAGTAVEGRNALNDAPSLPPARAGPPPAPTVSTETSADRIADELAALAVLLARRLAEARAGGLGGRPGRLPARRLHRSGHPPAIGPGYR